MNEIADPYRAPSSDVASDSLQHEPEKLVNASRSRRFLTYLIDYVGQIVLLMALAVLAIILRPELADRLETMGVLAQWLLGLVGVLIYYVPFEGLFGRTPGKWICGTRVVDQAGGNPTLGQTITRTFSRMVPFEAFSVLFSDDANVRGWHDTWAKTRVVRTR